MRVLIYEPLPDINRAPIIAQLAKTLMDDGHEVLVVLEEKLIYTLLGRLTHQGVINCSRTWRRHIATNPKIKTYRLDTPPGIYWFVTPQNLGQRLSKIAQIREEQYSILLATFNPEKIFVWNGQHEHLQDFMILAKQTHTDKFIYMECGWFPQKATIYFDTEGVNAASSIAKTPPRILTHEEKTSLDHWLQKYSQPQQSPRPKTIFVPLQVDTDTNIRLYSPFENMHDFIAFLETWIPHGYEVVFRPHPLFEHNKELQTTREGFRIDFTTSLDDLLSCARLVIGINSTVLLEAIARNKDVICFGDGFLEKTPVQHNFFQAKINTLSNKKELIYKLVFEKQDSTLSCKRALQYTNQSP